MVNILTDKELKQEIEDYRKTLKKSKIYEVFFITISFILVLINSISLIIIYVDHGVDIDVDIPFWSSIGVSVLTLIIFVPFTLIWYYKVTLKIQVHMPVILLSHVIDVVSIIVSVFNFITAILAAFAPIFIHGQFDEDQTWYADQKVVYYIIVCAVIFLLWSILFPITQDRLIEKENVYFNRYALFHYDKIPEYIAFLKKIYPKRVAEFNESIKNVKPKVGVDKIFYTPITTGFSYYNRRCFKGHLSDYGFERDLIKYCVFVQIFEHIHREEIKLEHMKEHFTKFTILKDKNIIKHFNSKFLKRIL